MDFNITRDANRGLIVNNKYLAPEEYVDHISVNDIEAFLTTTEDFHEYRRDNSLTMNKFNFTPTILNRFELFFHMVRDYDNYADGSADKDNFPNRTVDITFKDGKFSGMSNNEDDAVSFFSCRDMANIFSSEKAPDGTYTVDLDDNSYHNTSTVAYSFHPSKNLKDHSVNFRLPDEHPMKNEYGRDFIYFARSENLLFFFPVYVSSLDAKHEIVAVPESLFSVEDEYDEEYLDYIR